MKEKHFAYKITRDVTGFLSPHIELQNEKMLDLLKEINHQHYDGIFWVFKQLENQEEEPLCIVDCKHNRIYYHHSGQVDNLQETINKLTH